MFYVIYYLYCSHNYVHLDIKPGNILLRNNRYKLCDFGLTLQLINDANSNNGSTSSSSNSCGIAPRSDGSTDVSFEEGIVDCCCYCCCCYYCFRILYLSVDLVWCGVMIGDTKYMARELLDWGFKDLYKCDMFSLGIAVVEYI